MRTMKTRVKAGVTATIMAVGMIAGSTIAAVPAQAVPQVLNAKITGSSEVNCRMNLNIQRVRILNAGHTVQSVKPCSHYRTGWEGSITYRTTG